MDRVLEYGDDLSRGFTWGTIWRRVRDYLVMWLARSLSFSMIGIILLAGAVLFFLSAVSIYAAFYWWMVPRMHESIDVFFDYSVSPPAADVSLISQQWSPSQRTEHLYHKNTQLLSSGRTYDVDISLRVPDSERNQNIGMVTFKLAMFACDGATLSHSHRSLTPEFVGTGTRTAGNLARFVSYFWGSKPTREEHVMVLSLMDDFLEDSQHYSCRALVTLSKPNFEIYKASLRSVSCLKVKMYFVRWFQAAVGELRFNANLYGISYMVYHWFFFSLVFGVSTILVIQSFNAKLYGISYVVYHWFFFSLFFGVSTILAIQSCIVLVAAALLAYTCFKRFIEHEPGAPQSPVELVLFAVHWLVRFVYDPQQQVDMLQRQVDMMQPPPRRTLPDSDRMQIVELSDDESGDEGERAVAGDDAPRVTARSSDDLSSEPHLHSSRRRSSARTSQESTLQGGEGFWAESEEDEKTLGENSGQQSAYPLLRRRHQRRGGESSDLSRAGPSDQVLPVSSRGRGLDKLDSVQMRRELESVRTSEGVSRSDAAEEEHDGVTPPSAPPPFEE